MVLNAATSKRRRALLQLAGRGTHTIAMCRPRQSAEATRLESLRADGAASAAPDVEGKMPCLERKPARRRSRAIRVQRLGGYSAQTMLRLPNPTHHPS